MIITEPGSFGERMTWLPDPPVESKFIDIGIFLLPTLFSSLIGYG